MDCADARHLLLDLVRERLAAPLAESVRSHLSGCPACRRAAAAEAALEAVLTERLPHPAAPAALKTRLLAHAALAGASLAEASARAPAPPPAALGVAARARAGRFRFSRFAAPALAAAMALFSVGLLAERRWAAPGAEAPRLTDEFVNDHLRFLAALRPLELESAENHQVKPWFEGRLDFAPVVPVPDVRDLALRGGAVGYVLDRRAAVVAYTLRRHAVTMLVFRADGLSWPDSSPLNADSPGFTGATRGFSVVAWRAGALGYALVSDVDPSELKGLAQPFAAATVR
jgi:anti-sigma factor RsiW